MAAGILGYVSEVDGDVEVRLDSRVMVAFEQAQQFGRGARYPGPQEVRRIGTSRECLTAYGKRVGLRSAEEGVTEPAASRSWIDCQQPHVGPAVGLDRGHDAGVGVTADYCWLL